MFFPKMREKAVVSIFLQYTFICQKNFCRFYNALLFSEFFAQNSDWQKYTFDILYLYDKYKGNVKKCVLKDFILKLPMFAI